LTLFVHQFNNEQTFHNQTVIENKLCLESKRISYVWNWYIFSLDSIETLPSHRHFQLYIAVLGGNRNFCNDWKCCGRWKKNL